MREDYYKASYEFEVENNRIRFINDLKRKQDTMKRRDTEKDERIQKKKAEIESMQNPYGRQIETCSTLISYCQGLKKQMGLVPPSDDQVAKETQKEIINEYNR